MLASSVSPDLTESSTEALLVPKLQAPSATELPFPFPVHKTLVYGNGLDSAIAFGRFASDSNADTSNAVKLAVDLPAPSQEVDSNFEQSTTAEVNIDVGSQALASFRESVNNSIIYERGWFKSGLPVVSKWMVHNLQSQQDPGSVKPVLKDLVTSVASDAEDKIMKEDMAQVAKLATMPTDHDISASITSHLEEWAEKSHEELRDQLDEAFLAKSWHKLSWWKLFWRVDDVTMISSELLERRWLVSAEKNSIYLAGRMSQAGFPEDVQNFVVDDIPEMTTQETAPTAENLRTELSTDVRKPLSWPEYISTARTELVRNTVPPLQALAQRLILQTFSTTSISSAISALLYVSVSTFSVFEAAAVGVLGLTFSLRRMQKVWEGARESWQGTVREEGRMTLKRTEDVARLIIAHKKGGVPQDADGVRERKAAREAVNKVREALAKLQ